jgi:hypothetical protein
MGQLEGIPGKVSVVWNPDVRAMIDTWTNYVVTLDEFRDCVAVRGVNYAKANGGRAWIVDSSGAKGAFPQAIQDYIGSTLFPLFAKSGIKWFITVSSQSVVTNMSIAHYSSQAGPHGLQLVEAASAAGAVEWLKKHAK